MARLHQQQKEALSALIFAMMVGISDGYFQMIQSGAIPEMTITFFRLAYQLPIELQMLLSNRVYNINKNYILNIDFEDAFVYLL